MRARQSAYFIHRFDERASIVVQIRYDVTYCYGKCERRAIVLKRFRYLVCNNEKIGNRVAGYEPQCNNHLIPVRWATSKGDFCE